MLNLEELSMDDISFDGMKKDPNFKMRENLTKVCRVESFIHPRTMLTQNVLEEKEKDKSQALNEKIINS